MGSVIFDVLMLGKGSSVNEEVNVSGRVVSGERHQTFIAKSFDSIFGYSIVFLLLSIRSIRPWPKDASSCLVALQKNKVVNNRSKRAKVGARLLFQLISSGRPECLFSWTINYTCTIQIQSNSTSSSPTIQPILACLESHGRDR